MTADPTNVLMTNQQTGFVRTISGPLVVSVLTLVAVLTTLDPADYRPGLPPGPGITLDESFNVQMGVYLVESLKSYGLGILDPQSLDEVFGNPAYNPDHPPLGRLWLGVFHELSRAVAPVDSGDNPFVTIHARTGSAFAFALTIFLIGAFATRRWGQLAGLTSAVSLAVMPRLFGHAHLASLETFMGLTWTIATLGVIQIWSRHDKLEDGVDSSSKQKVPQQGHPPGDKAAALGGLLIGLALLTKIQAILLPPLVAMWAFWHWRLSALRPLAVSGVATVVVFVAGWPWLWTDLSGHLIEYFGRTTDRVSLNVWYVGRVFKDVDAPWHYPWVMTLVTIPAGVLLLAGAGLWGARRRLINDPSVSLIAGSVFAPLVLFSLPGVAVYDGARLFLVAFPGLALLSGLGMSRFRGWLVARGWPHKLIPEILLAAQLVGIVTTTPYSLSYYNVAIGGTSGAECLGFEVSYWGDSFSRRFMARLVDAVPDGTIVQVAPVLHQFQLAEIERQVPILAKGQSPTGRRVRLVAAEQPLATDRDRPLRAAPGSSSAPTEYLAVFHRRADAPSPVLLEKAGWKMVSSESCQGVIVASLWRR